MQAQIDRCACRHEIIRSNSIYVLWQTVYICRYHRQQLKGVWPNTNSCIIAIAIASSHAPIGDSIAKCTTRAFSCTHNYMYICKARQTHMYIQTLQLTCIQC